MPRENWKPGEEDMEFKTPDSVRETKKEFAVEVRKEDIGGVKKQMERERQREGLEGGQSIAFEGAALEKLRKIAPEENIEKAEFNKEDWEKCKDRLEDDLKKTEIIGKEKGWSREEIESEKSWIREFQKSYLKDIDSEKFKSDKDLKISGKEWQGMARDLERKIKANDWHNVIPRAGHMHNLEPDKFNEEILPLLGEDAKKGILSEIEILRKGDPASPKEKRQRPNPWELASRIRYVLEFLPDLKSEMEIDESDWKNMDSRLEEARNRGDYWQISYQLCNMKILEKMIKNGEIRTTPQNY